METQKRPARPKRQLYGEQKEKKERQIVQFEGDFDFSVLGQGGEMPKEIICSFSRGKDSIATYLKLREHIEHVQPYFYYIVPGLEFVEESLHYYEQKMGCRIIRMPAPGFYTALRTLMYQPPTRIWMIQSFDLPDISHDLLKEAVIETAGFQPDVFNAVGIRSKDSMQRRFIIQQHGVVNFSRRICYPIHNYSKERVLETITRAGWKLPVDYRYFSSSFDGLYVKFLAPIKKHFPNDYAKICEWFPMCDLEVARYEAFERKHGRAPYGHAV